MKTKHEQATEYKEKRIKAHTDYELDITRYIPCVEYESEKGFLKGFEAAREWIPISELPETNEFLIKKGDEIVNDLVTDLLVKTKNGQLFGNKRVFLPTGWIWSVETIDDPIIEWRYEGTFKE